MSRALAIKDENAKLALARRTVAKDCNNDEFRLFIHMCQAVGLDPLRRQCHAFVFSKHDPQKRQLTLVTSIGGYRSIAARTGNYRPDDDEPQFTMGEVDEKTNPKGIVSCKVKVFQFSHGQWWPAVGTARWEEYVPLRDGAIDKSKQGWIKMPFIMLAKCAEAAALRKCWPDDFANTHTEEETHREETLDAIAAVEMAERDERLQLVGGGADSYIVDWMDGSALVQIRGGDFHDSVMGFISANRDEPLAVRAFQDRNKHALQAFWAMHKSDALNLKREFEKVITTPTQIDIEEAIEAAS